VFRLERESCNIICSAYLHSKFGMDPERSQVTTEFPILIGGVQRYEETGARVLL